MAVTKEQVVALLQQDNLDYELAAEKIGNEALPYLVEIVKLRDSKLASRATYLAAFRDLPGSAEIIKIAAQSHDPVVRVAAAASIKMISPRTLKSLQQSVLIKLLDDKDPGVRKWALQGIENKKLFEVKDKVREMIEKDPLYELREKARRTHRILSDN